MGERLDYIPLPRKKKKKRERSIPVCATFEREHESFNCMRRISSASPANMENKFILPRKSLSEVGRMRSRCFGKWE